MKPSAVKDVVIGASLVAVVVLAQRGKKRPELRISNDVCCLGRSGSVYFPTCFLLGFVSSAGLFTHVLCGRSGMLFLLTCFPHWLISGMFNCFLLSVCFISIRICCQVLVFGFVVATGGKAAGMFTYLRRRHSLRSGMFLLSACFGMLAFLACLSTFFFRPAAFHTQLRPGAGLACGR